MTELPVDDARRLSEAASALSAAIPAIADDFYGTQLRLGAQMLSNEVSTVLTGANARTVKGLAFALNDLKGIAGELDGQSQEVLQPHFDALSDFVGSLETQFVLSAGTVKRMTGLARMLEERRDARERQTYLPAGAERPPLPHDPRELQPLAAAIQQELSGTGFGSAALDRLVADPASFEIRDVTELVDDINTIIA